MIETPPDYFEGLKRFPQVDVTALANETQQHIASTADLGEEGSIINEHFAGASDYERRGLAYILRQVRAPWMHTHLTQMGPRDPGHEQTPYTLHGPWAVFIDLNRFGDIMSALRDHPEDRNKFLAVFYEEFNNEFLKFGFRLGKQPGGDSLLGFQCTPDGALGAAHIVNNIPTVFTRMIARIPAIFPILEEAGIDKLTASSSVVHDFVLRCDAPVGQNHIVPTYDMSCLTQLQGEAERGECRCSQETALAFARVVPRFELGLAGSDEIIPFAFPHGLPEFPGQPIDPVKETIAQLKLLISQGYSVDNIATNLSAYLRPVTRHSMSMTAAEITRTDERRCIAFVYLPDFMEILGSSERDTVRGLLDNVRQIIDKATGPGREEDISFLTFDENKLILEGTDLAALFHACHAISICANTWGISCRIGIAQGDASRGPLAHAIDPYRDLEQSEALVTAARLATSSYVNAQMVIAEDLLDDPRIAPFITVSGKEIPVKEGTLKCFEVRQVHPPGETKPHTQLFERDDLIDKLFDSQFTLVAGSRGMGKSEVLKQCTPHVYLVSGDLEASLWNTFGDDEASYSSNALFAALRERSEAGRIVIGIDDLHAYPQSALHYLNYFIRRLQDENILNIHVIATYNPDLDADFSGVDTGFKSTFFLEPLSKDAIQQIVRARYVVQKLSPQSLMAVAALGGVPAYIHDALPFYLLRDAGHECDPDALLDQRLREMVKQRQDFNVLLRCSVFPLEFRLHELAALYVQPDTNDLSQTLRRLVENGALECEDDVYRFRIEPMRLNAYRAASDKDEWHRRAANYYKTSSPSSYLHHMNVVLATTDSTDDPGLCDVIKVAAHHAQPLIDKGDYAGALQLLRPTVNSLRLNAPKNPFDNFVRHNMYVLLRLTRQALCQVDKPAEAFDVAAYHYERVCDDSEHFRNEWGETRYKLLIELFRTARAARNNTEPFERFSSMLDTFHAESSNPSDMHTRLADLQRLRDFLRARSAGEHSPAVLLADPQFNIDPFPTTLPPPEAIAYSRNRIYLLTRDGQLDRAIGEASEAVGYMRSHRNELDPTTQINLLYSLLYAAFMHAEDPDGQDSPTYETVREFIDEIIQIADDHKLSHHRRAQGLSMRVEFREFDMRLAAGEVATLSPANHPVDVSSACWKTLLSNFADSDIDLADDQNPEIKLYMGFFHDQYLQHYCLANPHVLPNRVSDFQSHVDDKRSTAEWLLQQSASDSQIYLQAQGLLAEACFVQGGEDNMSRASQLTRSIIDTCRPHIALPGSDFYKKLFYKMSVLWTYITVLNST